MKNAQRILGFGTLSRRALLYALGLKDELKKVSWTAQDELVIAVKLVVAADGG